MSQSLPSLKLGLVLELVILAFEINAAMPTDFSLRKAYQLLAMITFNWTLPLLEELIESSVINHSGAGTGAFVTNFL